MSPLGVSDDTKATADDASTGSESSITEETDDVPGGIFVQGTKLRVRALIT